MTTSLDTGRQSNFGPFDGVIVTGPGPARHTFGSFTDAHLFDAESVWKKLPDLRRIVSAGEEQIIIVGGGGAAAAIAAWFVSEGFTEREIAL